MHQVLYRKWRPRTFDEVSGQEHITSVLKYEVQNGDIAHAYLFCGSRGTGKTTCAKILSRAVNCEHPQNGNPCGVCAACRSVLDGTATDVVEMDAASNNGVDDIRSIRDAVIYPPAALRYRVYIIDEVHMLSGSAFNALLKTLEEPPAHIIFILATTELQKLPATIVSRCQRFEFRRIAVPVLTARIQYIAKEEQIRIEDAAAQRIAKLAQGGMRDSISLLDLCAGTGKVITPALVDEVVGSAGREEMFAMVRAVADRDYPAVLAGIDRAVRASRDLTVFWQDLTGVYRDILVMRTVSDGAEYLDLTDSEAEQLKTLAAALTKETLLSHLRQLDEAFAAMQRAGSMKRMTAEMALLRLCEPTLPTLRHSCPGFPNWRIVSPGWNGVLPRFLPVERCPFRHLQRRLCRLRKQHLCRSGMSPQRQPRKRRIRKRRRLQSPPRRHRCRLQPGSCARCADGARCWTRSRRRIRCRDHF